MSKLNILTELLLDLVSIPSVNPRVKNADSFSNEIELANFIYHLLRSKGIDVFLQEVEQGRSNVIAHIKKGKNGEDGIVLLSAHMDTYPASFEEFTPRIENNFLYGRGSADAKGSLAAMMHAFMKSAQQETRREAYLVASIDEEHGMLGAKKLLDLGIRPDLAITGEPTQLIPIVTQKGIIRGTITILGLSSHAAYPERNAIFSLGTILQAIELFNESLQAEKNGTSLTPSSFTPTRIIDNGDMNGTPSEVTLYFDARFLPHLSSDQMINKLEVFLKEKLSTEIHFKIDDPLFVLPPNACSRDLPIVSNFFEIVKNVTGSCIPGEFSYGSEAGVFSSFSKSSLVFGPGDPKYSHKPGECLDLDELKKAEKVFSHLLTKPFRVFDYVPHHLEFA